MPKHKYISWTYTGQRPTRKYHDPRLPIARQIGWTKLFGTETSFTLPEPDNYNRAVITLKPVECPFIEDQVIYKDFNKNAWATVLYVPEQQQAEFELWLSRTDIQAHWRHTNAPEFRRPRSILL
jgi:hypothetical protein